MTLPHAGTAADNLLRLRDDPFAVLGLRAGCTEKEAKAAYHKLALSFHPDKADGLPRSKALEVFHVIQHAFDSIRQQIRHGKTVHRAWHLGQGNGELQDVLTGHGGGGRGKFACLLV